MNDKLYFCTRVYSNFDMVYAIRDEAGKDSWLEHNRESRPGCALFIDGKHDPDTGYLSSNAQAISKLEEYFTIKRSTYINEITEADKLAMRKELTPSGFNLGSRVRYPDDRDIFVSEATKKALGRDY